MAKQAAFDQFMSNIEPSATTVSHISSIQKNLRDYLKSHETYKDIHADTFLSGSYSKHTSIRPVKGDKKRDVDIIVVTTYSAEENSADVLNELRDILAEKSIYDSAAVQHHSVGIEMDDVSVDVVPVISDEEDDQLYYVGDLENGDWTPSDPKGHKAWSTQVNKEHHEKYKPLVKIFKWWRRVNCPEDVKYPKGITLEKIIADNLGDSSLSTENFLIETMQNIVASFLEDYVCQEKNPVIADPSDKIENNDLLVGYSVADFAAFIHKLEEHVNLLGTEGVTNDTWRIILGTEFPKGDTTGNYTLSVNVQKCLSAQHRKSPPWPMERGQAVLIRAYVEYANGERIAYTSNGEPLEKHCSLHFQAMTGVKRPYQVIWQIVNTGEEAQQACCLRGCFYNSNDGDNGRFESTLYAGTHSVQCFVIQDGICKAKSKEYIINIK